MTSERGAWLRGKKRGRGVGGRKETPSNIGMMERHPEAHERKIRNSLKKKTKQLHGNAKKQSEDRIFF